MKKILCLCLVLALLPICGMAEIVSLDEQVDQIFRDAKTVGGAFLVARNGEIVYERYFGEQQKTTHVPVTERAISAASSADQTGDGHRPDEDDGRRPARPGRGYQRLSGICGGQSALSRYADHPAHADESYRGPE
ncbi:MAG: hypothetical protein ACLR4A_14935 [Christensenellales bacterium]